MFYKDDMVILNDINRFETRYNWKYQNNNKIDTRRKFTKLNLLNWTEFTDLGRNGV